MNENRQYIIQFVFVLVGLIFLARLFSIQVLDNNYKLAANNNIIQKVIEYPYRGLIYDRNGELLVYNQPVYDLMVIPKEVRVKDTLAFTQLLGITKEEFEKKLKDARSYSYVKPSVFMKQLSNTTFAQIQGSLIDFPGFHIQPRTVRSYPYKNMAHVFGYIGEISKQQLAQDTTGYYRQGDYIGISGIEATYEKPLRGKTGVSYKMVNVRGIEKGKFKGGEYDTLPVRGENLISTIDIELQTYAETLLEGKVGSIVAIEPKTGEILAMVSAPSYDPNILSGRDFGENYAKLVKDSLKPLFNRPLMGAFPPGSIYKVAQALVALEEGVITPQTRITCNRRLIGCHGSHTYEDLSGAITVSCNPYFREIYRRMLNQEISSNTFKDTEIGLELWREHMLSFGFGRTLGIDIPNEKGGYMPAPSLYNRIYGEGRWKFSNIYSNSVGQGEVLTVPLQMANFAAIIANRGYYVIPHLIKGIGDDGRPLEEYREKHYTTIDPKHFDVVIDAMENVVEYGTGQYRAKVRGISICGKTGTVENDHGEDHSVFIAFAPKEDPVIAMAVYVENAGQGARAAAGITGLMIEKYIKGCTDNVNLQDYILRGQFLH
jgi:penicillin-binding protein 2